MKLALIPFSKNSVIPTVWANLMEEFRIQESEFRRVVLEGSRCVERDLRLITNFEQLRNGNPSTFIIPCSIFDIQMDAVAKVVIN